MWNFHDAHLQNFVLKPLVISLNCCAKFSWYIVGNHYWLPIEYKPYILACRKSAEELRRRLLNIYLWIISRCPAHIRAFLFTTLLCTWHTKRPPERPFILPSVWSSPWCRVPPVWISPAQTHNITVYVSLFLTCFRYQSNPARGFIFGSLLNGYPDQENQVEAKILLISFLGSIYNIYSRYVRVYDQICILFMA